MFKPLVTSLMCAALAFPAAAHTPYLVPFNFAPTEAYITVHDALTDNTFFTPEFPIKGDDFYITDDKGVTIADKGLSLHQLALFESPLPHEGTFRISTGNRDVRTLTLAEIDGRWKPVKMPENGLPVAPPFADQTTLPAGTRIVPVKTMVRSESYVSYNKPSDAVPPPEGRGLELVPLSHPNRLFAGGTFSFALQFDGKPLANAHYAVFRAYDTYETEAYAANGDTGTDGKSTLTFVKPGIYVIEVSRNWQESDPSDPRTWLYSLTLEVAP